MLFVVDSEQFWIVGTRSSVQPGIFCKTSLSEWRVCKEKSQINETHAQKTKS